MKFARRTVLSGLTLLAAGAWEPVLAAATPDKTKDLQLELERAIQRSGVLRLPAGTFTTPGLKIGGSIRLEGIAGRTRIVSENGGPVLVILDTEDVTVSGITFEGTDVPPTDDNRGAALVMARNVQGLVIESCKFISSRLAGLRLEASSGRIVYNQFADIEDAGLLALDSRGLEISGNHLHGIGNNGIQVWASQANEDGTIVSNNRIERVNANGGGTGQNGNGINVYRAGNVMIAGNRISDCAFSAVRNNSGSNCQITGNSISRTGEVAIYCEFAFEGAVVSSNLIEDVAFGISITNFNEGGRLAVIANNVVRNVKGGGTLEYTSAIGIAAEADAQVTGNVIENASDTGISLGWGQYCRNLSATSNTIRNCGRGISFSVSPGAGPVTITNNRIAGAKTASIIGMNHQEPATADLGLPNATPPAQGLISGNVVS